jgi:c-di-GMP-binding flagellar brake protein YcgR
MSLSENEVTAISNSCDLNQNLYINVYEHEKLHVYRSRFLSVNFNNGYIIIDLPSAETQDAKNLSRGESIEIFFEIKTFRYLFSSRVLEHTQFKLNERSFFALKISLPSMLQDGDKREYFRVPSGMRPPVIIKFIVFAKDATQPIMSAVMKDTQQEFRAEMLDVSGGGFSIRVKPGDKGLNLEKGDIIKARFKFRAGYEEIEAWAEVRNRRKYKDTDIVIWGLRFMGKEKNTNINHIRNKILRFVTERQREILAQ